MGTEPRPDAPGASLHAEGAPPRVAGGPSDEDRAGKRGPLDRVLAPQSIAVIGASQNPTKRGYQVVRALLAGGFRGSVHPVHPAGGSLLGLPVTPSIEALPDGVDLAVVCTPAETVAAVVEACGGKRVAGAVVLALGFREAGEEGARREEAMRAAARRTGVRIIGPNTSGMLNLTVGLDLIGIPNLRAGGLALLAQSGNTTLSLLREAADPEGEGFSLCVGVGNETDLHFHEYLAHLSADRSTRAVLIYAEGFRDGPAFLEAARDLARRKPVVLLKGGRSREGEASARSHTGSISTSHDVLRTALRQAGVVEVTRSDELLPVGRVLARQPLPGAGLGVAILSDGGGQATLAADTLSEAGVGLAPLAETTRTRLRALLGPAAGVGNPVDVAGACDRNPELFPRILEVILADEAVGGVLLVGLFGGYAVRFAAELAEAESEAAVALARVARQSEKPLVVHSIYAEAPTPPLRHLESRGFPAFRSLEIACTAIFALWERARLLPRIPGSVARVEEGGGGDEVAQARREGRNALLETEVRTLLERRGVPVVPGVRADDAEAAADAARVLEGAVCLKVLSPTILHKTEAGGVVLGVTDPPGAAAAFERLRSSVEAWAEGAGSPAGFRGALVTRMEPAPPVELLVGAHRDPVFGPVLTVGAGGTAVEILGDVSLRMLPVGDDEVSEMLDGLRIAPLLRGYRGAPPIARDPLLAVVRGVARVLLETPEVAEIEVNPVFAYPDRAVVVDARAYLRGADAGPGQ